MGAFRFVYGLPLRLLQPRLSIAVSHALMERIIIVGNSTGTQLRSPGPVVLKSGGTHLDTFLYIVESCPVIRK